MSGQTPTFGLHYLQEELVTLSSLAETMLLDSVELLQHCGLDGLEQLAGNERMVREKRLAIELAVLQFIANERPKGGDLRAAVATIEVAAALERVGEYATSVTRINSLTVGYQLRKPLAGIHRLAVNVQAVLDRVMVAFVQRDLPAARSVLDDVKAIDALYLQVYQGLLEVMNSYPLLVTQAIYLSRAAYSLRRAAERVIGISEWVAFVVVGTVDRSVPEQSPKPLQGDACVRLLDSSEQHSALY